MSSIHSPPTHARRLRLILLSLVLAACGDGTATGVAPARVHPSWITSEAAQSLDEDGRFVLQQRGERPSEEITAQQAKELAEAWWHDFGRWVQRTLERDRGSAIHARELRACDRAYYASSAYQPVSQQANPAFRKIVGAWWLVGLCTPGGIQEVVVGVSSYATDARISFGRNRLEQPGEGNFVSIGVPVGMSIPLPPEHVVEVATKLTGRRIAKAPQLVMRPRPKGPSTAVWQIALDGSVNVTGSASKATRPAITLFAGALNGWAAPALADGNPAAAENGSADEVHSVGVGTNTTEVKVQRRPGVPRTLELISVGGH